MWRSIRHRVQAEAYGRSTGCILTESSCSVGVALHTIVVPANEIVDIQIRPPLVFADLLRGKGFAFSFPLKIDSADICRHVAIKRKSGFIKHIRFTPDDPDKFVDACKTIINKE